MKINTAFTVLIIIAIGSGIYSVINTKTLLAPAVPTTPEELINSKTYTNNEFGFEFSYPNNLVLNEDYSSGKIPVIDIYDPSEIPGKEGRNNTVAIYIDPETSNQSLQEYVRKEEAGNFIREIEQAKLGNEAAYSGYAPGVEGRYAIIGETRRAFVTLSIGSVGSTAKEMRASLTEGHKQIISSFKVIK